VTGDRVQRHLSTLAVALVAGGFGTLTALAQTRTDGGSVSTARISSQLEFNDNYDLRDDSLGDALIWNTVIGFGLERYTRIEEFVADVEGTLRIADLPEIGDEAEFDNPLITLGYQRAVEDSEIGFNVRFNRADIEFFDPLSDIDPNGEFDDTRGGGTRESFRGNFNLGLNTQGPVSFGLTGNYSDISFTDTDDPDLDSRRRGSVRGNVGFRLSPILELTTGARYSLEDINDDQDTERETVRGDIGFVGSINPRARLTARVGYSEVETRRNSGDERTSGFVGDLGVAITQRGGDEVRANLSTDLDENGERYSVTVGSTRNWPNAELDGDIGLSTSGDTDVRVVGNVSYLYALPRTEFSATFRQIAGVDDDGDDVLNTFASIGVRQSLDRLSSVNLQLNGGLTRNESAENDDTERLNFSASFSRALTRDWRWNAGYRRELRDDDRDGRAVSNSVFVGINREFRAIR